MKRKAWMIALVVMFAVGLCVQVASAYTINYFSLQYRNHEGKGLFNRIAFDIKDDSGKYITENKLESIELLDPDGSPVQPGTMTFDGAYREIDGVYDGNTGKWTFGAMFWYSGYYGEVPGDLLVGTYTLNIQFDGVPLSKTWYYAGKVALPYVKSSTIKPRLDGAGNLLVTWTVDNRILAAARAYDKSARVSFEVYDGEKFTMNLYVRSPFHQGALVVPKAIVTRLKSLGDRFTVVIQLRTNNNCNRSHSARVDVPLSVGALGADAAADVDLAGDVQFLDGAVPDQEESDGGRN